MGYFPQAAQAQIVNRGNNGCPAGTRIDIENNILVNGDFSEGYTGFTSELPQIGPENAYGEGYSVVNNTEAFRTNIGSVISVLDPKPFPGDPANGVPPSNSYYYSNPSNNDYITRNGAPVLWQQTVAVQPNTTYNLLFYIDNLLRVNPGDPASGQAPDSSGYPPVIEVTVGDGAATTILAPPAVIRNVPDQWVPVQVAFTTGSSQTTATLSLRDIAGAFFGTDEAGNYRAVFGDDFGFTAIAFNQCLPIASASPEIRKSVRRLRDNDNNGVLNVGDDLAYTITITNTSTTDNITDLVIGDAIPTQLQVLRDDSNPIQFPSGFSAVASLPTTNFNGTGNPITLTNPGTLAAGQSITLTYNARIQPGATSPIINQARANFAGDGGQPILSDASDSTNPTQPGSAVNPGTPNPDGNINQPNAGPADPTIVNLSGAVASGNRLILVKRITAANRGGVPISGVAFTEVDADADANAINQAGLRPIGVREIPSTIPLQSGDDVQYTIYFLAEQSLNNLNFCDLIPGGTTYIPNSISIVGAGAGADQGRFFSPLTSLEQLPEGSICENRTNPNGAVIVKLGNVLNGRPGSVSLRVRIN
jgi:fimbrial isopeptide formation D2 family protein/uncharacterized repeat protein (TIGR01451 family)